MKETAPVAQATNDEAVLPERVQETLGQLMGVAKEGLLALSVEVGLGVLSELFEEEVEQLVGPKGKWNWNRTAVRHGHEDGAVTLGARRVQVRRPRARTVDGESEVPLQTYEHFADRDRLRGVVLERMLTGVSTRKNRRGLEPVGEEVETGARSTSKSAESRMFAERTERRLRELTSRPLADLRLAVLMLDGIELHGEHRRAGDHHRRRQARAPVVGRLDRERDRGERAAGRFGRPGAGCGAGTAVPHRRLETR